jgi:type III secretory pathway component EscS
MMLCAGAYLAPYLFMSGWWRFIPSTFVILAAGTLAMGREATTFFGLRASKRDALAALALLVGSVAASRYVLTDYVGTYLEVVRTATVRSHVHQFFQVLNDELIMRAALLTLVLVIIRSATAAIILAAAFFALTHSIFYSATSMQAGTLLTLFSLGVIGNTLFVAFRHIWYGFSLHFAWNVYRFNTRYYLDGRGLWEGESFNYIEGNDWIVLGSVLAMLAVYGTYVSQAGRRSRAPAA